MLFEILCLLLRLFVCLLLLLSLLLSRSNVGAGVVVSGAHRLRLGLCLSVGAFLLVCFRRSSMAKAPINVLILPCGSSVPYPSPHDICIAFCYDRWWHDYEPGLAVRVGGGVSGQSPRLSFTLNDSGGPSKRIISRQRSVPARICIRHRRRIPSDGGALHSRRWRHLLGCQLCSPSRQHRGACFRQVSGLRIFSLPADLARSLLRSAPAAVCRISSASETWILCRQIACR